SIWAGLPNALNETAGISKATLSFHAPSRSLRPFRRNAPQPRRRYDMNATDTSLTRAQRLKRIADDVLANGSMLVDDLAAALNVSRMTIHRDLDDLEKQGILRKVRNGATAQPSSVFESNVAFRLASAVEAKRRIGKYAATLIEP